MQNSPLEKLPAELRNKIYRLVVSDNKPLTVCARSPGYHKAIQPPITRVCRQIRDESLTMFYHCNEFVFEVTPAESWTETRWDIADRVWEIERWLHSTSENYRAAIRGLLIVCGSNCRAPDCESMWQVLAEMLESYGYGYGGKEAKNNKLKCTIHIHLVFDLWASWLFANLPAGTSLEIYRREQETKSTKLFEDLGLDAHVTSEMVVRR